MLLSLLITLREGLEATLLLGLLLAVLARAGDTQDRRWVWLGVAAAVAASLAAGAALFATGAKLEGAAAAAFEAGAMLAAAAGSAAALFWLGFVLVVREGLETGLFLFAAVGEDRSLAALAGGLAGIAMAAGLGYAVYRGGSRLNVRVFFTVLNVILLGFGTYLVLRGVGELGELAAAGEAGELAGLAAGLYAGVMIWVLLREGRGARSAATFAQQHPDHDTGVQAGGEAGELARLAGGRQLPQLTHAAQHEVRAEAEQDHVEHGEEHAHVETRTAAVHGVAEPGGHGDAGQAAGQSRETAILANRGEEKQPGLQAFAHDQDEAQPEEGGGASGRRRDLAAELAAQRVRAAAHPDDHPGEHGGRGEHGAGLERRCGSAFELGAGGEERGARRQTRGHGGRDAQPDPATVLRVAGTGEHRQQEAEQQSGLETFAQRDEQREQHETPRANRETCAVSLG